MPSTVASLLAACHLEHGGVVRWNAPIPCHDAGVYIVSSNENPHSKEGLLDKPSFNTTLLQNWLSRFPTFTIDGRPATVDTLKGRLLEYWLPDENILYVGKADLRKRKSSSSKNGLCCRVGEYYTSRLGDGSHTGGQWLLTLAHVSSLFIHYAKANNPTQAEELLLAHFQVAALETLPSTFRDPYLPLPFANLQSNGRKQHGLAGYRKDKKRAL